MSFQGGLPEQIDAYFDGDLDEVETQRLGAWIMESSANTKQFLREVALHRELRNSTLAQDACECLNEASADSGQQTKWGFLGDLLPPSAGHAPILSLSLLAATLLLGVGAAIIFTRSPENRTVDLAKSESVHSPDGASQIGTPPKAVARLSRLWKPQWSYSTKPLAEWAPLAQGQVIDLVSGRAEVFFDAGAQLTLEAPVRFEVLGPKSGRVFFGAVTARVGEQAKGFSLVSSVGKVIDLGTEFGMIVRSDGEMDVVIFDGAVDLEHLSSEPGGDAATTDSGAVRSRLTTGEAVRIKPDGSARRIVSVNSDRFTWEARGTTVKSEKNAVIKSISDTIRTPGGGPFYEIVGGGLYEDVRAYVDRHHEWNGVDELGIPDFLLGADYAKTFNSDKRQGIELTVELARPANLYVFWDGRTKDVPTWLRDEFTDTGLKIGLDEASYRAAKTGKTVFRKTGTGPGRSIDVVYSIWHRKVSKAGSITLGPAVHGAMFGIAANALSEE